MLLALWLIGLGFVAEPAVAHVLESAIESVVHLPSGLLHTISFVVALSIVVVLHMVLGEMVPKNIAIAGPEQSARLLAPRVGCCPSAAPGGRAPRRVPPETRGRAGRVVRRGRMCCRLQGPGQRRLSR